MGRTRYGEPFFMALFPSTMPSPNRDSLGDLYKKINQIFATGAVGATSNPPFASTAPANGDTKEDSAAKICQILHVNGGL